MGVFSKKSVAVIFLSLAILGFANFQIVKAQQQTQSQLSQIIVNSTDAINEIKNKAKQENRELTTEEQQKITGYQGAIEAAKQRLQTKEYENNKTNSNAEDSGKSLFNKMMDVAKGLAKIGTGILTIKAFAVVMTVLGILAAILNIILLIAGALFDLSVKYSILEIGNLLSSNTAINTGWTLFRDSLNVAFIFIILYIAISMILGSFGGKAKTTITKVIVAAVFINFSMFITKFFIDISNIFSVALYNQIMANSVTTGSATISSILMAPGSLKSVFVKMAGVFSYTGQINMMVASAMNVFLAAVLVYFLIYAAFMLIGRTSLFLFLLVTSPIAFLGDTLPWIKKDLSDKWISTFTGQLVVAPVFFFLLFFIIEFGKSGILNSIANYGSLKAVAPEFDLPQYFAYILYITILVYAVKITKELSGSAARIGVAVVGGLAGATGGLLVGTAATSGSTLNTLIKNAGQKLAGAPGAGRISGALKTVGENKYVKTTAKFVKGGYAEETGLNAEMATFAREKLIQGLKEATGFDIKKTEKEIKEMNKKAEQKQLKETSKQAEAAGEQAAEGAGEELKRRKEIKEKAKKAAESDPVATNLKSAENQKQKDQDNYNKALEELKSALADNNDPAQINRITAAREAADSAKTALDISLAKVKKFREEFKKRQKEIQTEIAKNEYGGSWDNKNADEIDNELNKNLEQIERDYKTTAENMVRKLKAESIRRAGLIESIRSGYPITQSGKESTAKKIEKGEKGVKSSVELFEEARKAAIKEGIIKEEKEETKKESEKPKDNK